MSMVRIWIYAIVVFLTQSSRLALASAQDLDFKDCSLRQSHILLKPLALINARYFPSISFSYEYRPKAQTFLNGERHEFWIGFRWDFEDVFMDNQNQYTWRMFQMRAEKRFGQMQQEYLNPKTILEDAAGLADKIEKIGAEENLKARLTYYCERE